MKPSRSKAAVAVVIALAGAWIFGLLYGLPWVYGQKVHALVGQTRAVVEHELGPPTDDWGATDFQCDPAYPCGTTPQTPAGRVFLYAEGTRGYYLFFDRADELVSVQRVSRN